MSIYAKCISINLYIFMRNAILLRIFSVLLDHPEGCPCFEHILCIVVLGLEVLRNGFLCTGYLGALSCVFVYLVLCFVEMCILLCLL